MVGLNRDSFIKNMLSRDESFTARQLLTRSTQEPRADQQLQRLQLPWQQQRQHDQNCIQEGRPCVAVQPTEQLHTSLSYSPYLSSLAFTSSVPLRRPHSSVLKEHRHPNSENLNTMNIQENKERHDSFKPGIATGMNSYESGYCGSSCDVENIAEEVVIGEDGVQIVDPDDSHDLTKGLDNFCIKNSTDTAASSEQGDTDKYTDKSEDIQCDKGKLNNSHCYKINSNVSCWSFVTIFLSR